MPTQDELDYIESRLKSPVSRTHQMSIEGAKANDVMMFWIDKQRGDGSHWTIARYKGEHYIARHMGSVYAEPVPILESKRK